MGVQLCRILTYLHGQDPPVIHRDIKPQNVIMAEDGRVSLIDFGISRLFEKKARADTVAYGTQTFSPPEQYGFSQTDCRSDIFSLGALLRYLATGEAEPGRAPATPLERVAARCTAFDPKDRYADAEAVRRALLRTRPASRRRRAALAAAGVLLAAGAIVAGCLAWKSYQPLNDPNHTPAFITSRELQEEAADYLDSRFETELFEAGDTGGDVGYIRTLLQNVFGYDAEYVNALPPADPPLETPDSFLPWAFGDGETLSRDLTVYIVVKVFWPEVVGDWSSLKNDTGEYPGVRVSVAFAEKKGLLDGLNRPDHLTRGDVALLFANAARAYGDALPPQLAAAGETELSPSGFTEPLVEQAVRLMLGRSDGEALDAADLAGVTALYIVADRALGSQEEFYAAISDWYAGGMSVYGSIRTLADAALLPNLQRVCVAAQELDDISGLAGLTELEKVELKHNSVSDVTALAGLPKLVSVGLNDNPVKDLAPLTECPELRFLDLCDAGAYDPGFLDAMGDFEFLDLSNSTDSYLHLSGRSVRELKLCWTDMTSLDCLDGVEGIETLEINNSGVTDLSKLAQHPTIRALRLSGLAVSNLSVLLELPELERVTLSRDMEAAAEALGSVSFEILYE